MGKGCSRIVSIFRNATDAIFTGKVIWREREIEVKIKIERDSDISFRMPRKK